MKHTILILVILIISTINLVAQIDSLKLQETIDSIKNNEAKWLHRGHGSPYLFPPRITESTISIVPEVQGFNHLYFSLGISKDFYGFYRKGAISGNNILVGVEYSPFQKIIAPKLSFSQSFLGLSYRINALYYIESEMNRFSIRPEIGFGLFGLKRLKLMFGRNIFFKKNEKNKVNTWTGAIYYHYPIFPKRSKNYKLWL
jgi:hypothetical protein